MIRKTCALGATLSLCLGSATPALGQDYRYSGYDGPLGANATLNIRVPLGSLSAARSRPTFGLTLGFGRSMGAGSVDGREVVRQMRFGDFRFTDDGLRQARIVGFDFANPGRNRLFFSAGDEKSTAAIAAAAAAAAAVLCFTVICTGDDDEDEDESPPDTSNPG